MKKKVFALLLAGVMALGLTACGGKEPAAGSGTGPESPSQAEIPAETTPSSANKVVEADPAYNDMTDAELYELAQKESGTITIYSLTSKISKIAAAFQESYPGLQVECYDLKTSEIAEKVPLEHDSHNIVSDVIITSDATGDIYYQWYDAGYVEAYYPASICRTIDESFLEYGLTLYTVLDIWYYNSGEFPEGCPITNWWDLLDTNEDGSPLYTIYIKNISSDTTYLALFSQLVLMSDELEEAYKEKYGTDLEYTYDASKVPVEENNAGYEFLYRFAQGNISLVSDGDERIQAVAASTRANPGIANATGSKMTAAFDNGWDESWVMQMAPFSTMVRPTYIYLTSGCDNPAGARLFINYIMGGENPSENEGLKALLNYGCWTPRSDYVDTVNEIGLADFNYASPDIAGIYDTYMDVSDFWVYWHDKFAQ
ncbi:hypothetical protein [Oscillibacter sp.]|uniref:hypothetical protein n=1 Tax=Oscillibacter sp. TaxID=1945593 RepID=UPI002D7F46B3|nr:hypothetical protein [Oscillibacter sp.]